MDKLEQAKKERERMQAQRRTAAENSAWLKYDLVMFNIFAAIVAAVGVAIAYTNPVCATALSLFFLVIGLALPFVGVLRWGKRYKLSSNLLVVLGAAIMLLGSGVIAFL